MTENQKQIVKKGLKEKGRGFSSQLQPFLDQVNDLTLSQRILTVVLTLGLLCGGFFYFLYLPKIQLLTKLDTDMRQTIRRIQKGQMDLRVLKPLQEKKSELDQDFEKATQSLPESSEIPILLAKISASGKGAGLEFLLFKPEPEVRQDFYVEIPVSVEMLGGFHETVLFLDMLARIDRVVNVRDVDMQVKKERNISKILTRCQIVTYRFVEPEKPARRGGKKS